MAILLGGIATLSTDQSLCLMQREEVGRGNFHYMVPTVGPPDLAACKPASCCPRCDREPQCLTRLLCAAWCRRWPVARPVSRRAADAFASWLAAGGSCAGRLACRGHAAGGGWGVMLVSAAQCCGFNRVRTACSPI